MSRYQVRITDQDRRWEVVASIIGHLWRHGQGGTLDGTGQAASGVSGYYGKFRPRKPRAALTPTSEFLSARQPFAFSFKCPIGFQVLDERFIDREVAPARSGTTVERHYARVDLS